MDIKDRIKKAIETRGAEYETLRDLFDAVRLCEAPQEKREWLLYVRKMCRSVSDENVYELMRLTYVLGAQDGSFDDYCIALEWYRAP